MKLERCPKLPCGKADTPENTIRRLDRALRALHDYDYIEHRLGQHLYWSAVLIDHAGFRAMGKGISAPLCQAGALAEAAEWLATRPTAELPGYCTAHQDELERTLRLEDLLAHVATATPSRLARIKQSPCARHWVDGTSLVDGRTWKVPIEYVRRISGPNGLAAGNRREEALAHALCEVFERRAAITVLKQRLVVPTLDPRTVQDPIVREYMDFLDAKGIETILKDLSFGGALPCIGAYFFDPGVPEAYQFHHFFKVGSDFDPSEALRRCFTEYTQGRRIDEFARGGDLDFERLLAADFRRLRCMAEEDDNYLASFLFGMVPFADTAFLRAGPVIPFAPRAPLADFRDDIRLALDVLAKLRKDCIVVEHTHPEIGFPVVETIVPGYSDVLPYYPRTSRVLFEDVTRDGAIASYATEGT